MNVKYILLNALALASASVNANPAPVTDINLNRPSMTSSAVQATGSVEQRLAALERMVEARTEAQLRMTQQLQTLLDEALAHDEENKNWMIDRIVDYEELPSDYKRILVNQKY